MSLVVAPLALDSRGASAAPTSPKVTNLTPSVTQVNGAGGNVSFTASINGVSPRGAALTA